MITRVKQTLGVLFYSRSRTRRELRVIASKVYEELGLGEL